MVDDLRLKIIFYLFIGLLGYLFIAQRVAADSLSLGIDPPIITIQAIAPTTVNSTFSIQNKSDIETALDIQIKPFKAKGENGEIEYLKEALSIEKNILILDGENPVENLILGPRQEKDLILNIVLDEETQVSDYYFSILFISKNNPAFTSNSSLNEIGIATNVLLSVGEKELPKGVLEEFSTKLFFNSGPVPFNLRVKNNSIHLFKPTGYISIKNMFGQIIGKINLTGVNILSGSIRAVPNDDYARELRIQTNKSKSSYDFKKSIVLWKEGFLVGIYSATLNLSLTDEGPYFNRTIRFLAFPYQGIIIIILLIIAIIFIRKRLKIFINKTRI